MGATFRRRVAKVVLPPPTLEEACALPQPRLWGGLIPLSLFVLFALGRLYPHRGSGKAEELYNSASRALLEERYDDAAEYAHGALTLRPPGDLAQALQCLRGETLVRSGRVREAAEAFEAGVALGSVVRMPEALFGAARAHERAGEEGPARVARERLLREYPETPWAAKLHREP